MTMKGEVGRVEESVRPIAFLAPVPRAVRSVIVGEFLSGRPDDPSDRCAP